jgi:hypothetical protein
MRQDKVMMGVITEVMMAMTRGNALLITFPAQQRGARPATQFRSDEPLHHRSDEPSHQGLFPPSRSPTPLSWRFAVHHRNLDFSLVMRGLMRVLMRRNRHRGRHGLPHDPPVPKRTAGPWAFSGINQRLPTRGSMSTGSGHRAGPGCELSDRHLVCPTARRPFNPLGGRGRADARRVPGLRLRAGSPGGTADHPSWATGNDTEDGPSRHGRAFAFAVLSCRRFRS